MLNICFKLLWISLWRCGEYYQFTDLVSG